MSVFVNFSIRVALALAAVGLIGLFNLLSRIDLVQVVFYSVAISYLVDLVKIPAKRGKRGTSGSDRR